MDDAIWYPYAQMKHLKPPLEVVRAEGVWLELADGRRLIDAVASWWSVIHGYNHPELNRAIAGQLERFAHVMLGGLTHRPAMELAQKLVEITPAGLNHVFFADSGSVGVEVALKMAVQYWRNAGQSGKCKFLALKNAYHGDTTGAMAVCDPVDSMHAAFTGLLPQHHFLESPTASTLEQDVAALEAFLQAHHGELAGFIVEPLLQAAGGFHIYPPAYLAVARRLCDQYDVLLLFDEVATGFGRTGTRFAAEQAQMSPDIMILGKALTGGYCGHSATLASSKVFAGFYDETPDKALMHGPTFMGNALACAVAMKSIEIFQRENYLEKIAAIERILKERLLPIRGSAIKATRVLGATGVIEVHDSAAHDGLQEFAAEHGVWLRPFNRYVYTMPSYVISKDELLQVINVVQRWFVRK